MRMLRLVSILMAISVAGCSAEDEPAAEEAPQAAAVEEAAEEAAELPPTPVEPAPTAPEAVAPEVVGDSRGAAAPATDSENAVGDGDSEEEESAQADDSSGEPGQLRLPNIFGPGNRGLRDRNGNLVVPDVFNGAGNAPGNRGGPSGRRGGDDLALPSVFDE